MGASRHIRGLSILAVGVLIMGGCGGGANLDALASGLEGLASGLAQITPAPTSAGSTPRDQGSGPDATAQPVLGSWEGTASFHANVHMFDESTETGTFADEPSSITNRFELTEDITDEFQIGGKDVQYPIQYDVELLGTVANQGTSDKKSTIIDTHTLLAGCRFEETNVDHTTGSWTSDTYNSGGIKFEPDGSYELDIKVSGEPGTGVLPEPPLLPQTFTDSVRVLSDSDICKNPGGTVQSEEPPYYIFASDTRNPDDYLLTGSIDPANPGNVVAGSKEIEIQDQTGKPAGTVTVTWNLVHDGPIVLPKD